MSEIRERLYFPLFLVLVAAAALIVLGYCVLQIAIEVMQAGTVPPIVVGFAIGVAAVIFAEIKLLSAFWRQPDELPQFNTAMRTTLDEIRGMF